MSNDFNKGKLPKLWDFLERMHRENPELFRNASLIRTEVAKVWRDLADDEHCPNCGESMQEYVHKLDFFNALLLKEMGDVVKKRLASGMEFGEANQVHVVSEDLHDAVRHRTTQCRTLGLIAKVKTDEGKHDREAGWLITRRGFAALRGEAVPSAVIVFRNRIEEKPGETATLNEVFAAYDGEHAGKVGPYDPMEWVNFGGIHEGKML